MGNLFETVFIIHYISTLIMTGAIWLAQLSQYPLLVYVGRRNFIKYEHEHINRISGVAWFIIYIELFTSIILFFINDQIVPRYFWGSGLILIFVIWFATWAVQYPIHKKLEKGFDGKLHKKLVNSNWIRTISWTIRSLILTYILSSLL